MSQSDTRQRYANKNANQSRPSRPNWGSEARDFRPVGQRYGSVLVLSGPKRKQAGPAVRKPIPRPVNLPSQRKDRHAEGSLLGSKQGRPEDSSQQVESTTHSLNTQTWQSSNTGTWSAPQEATSRTDEYGFPIRSEAPINAREFPTLAASKQSGPPSKQRPQHEQADAYFSLDDRDTLPSEPKGADDRAFGSQREDHRPGSREDWRSSGGRAGFGGPDRAAGGDGREGRPFRDDVDSRLFTSRPAAESRRGAFGFHTQEQDRSRSSARGGGRTSDNGGGSTAFGPSSHSGRSGSRIEEYGLLSGDHPMGRGPAKQQDDYVGPAAHSAADVFSSTLLAAGVAPSTGGGLAGSLKTVVAEAPDSEEDEELVAHYKELELIKAEEEEKDRQRALAAEAAGAEESGAGSGEEEGEGEGDTWEDAAEKDAEGGAGVDADDPQGLKPIDPTRWQQRQAEIEEEDRLRRERAEAKKRALEEAIARREEDKTRAAREASEAALAALAAADQPLPANTPQVVVPPPPPPPRTAPSSGGSVPAQFPIQPPPPPPAAPSPAHDETAVFTSHSATDTHKPASTMESLPAVSASDSGPAQQPQQRRPDFIPAPAPARPAWGQALYTRPESSQKAPAAAAGVALHNNTTDSHGSNAPSQREAWASHDSMEVPSYWRDGALQEGASAPPRQRAMMGQRHSHDSASGGSARSRDANSHRDRDDTAGPGRNSGRGRRSGRGEGRGAGRGRHSSHSDVNSAPSATMPSAPIHSTSSTPPPGAPSVSASSNAASDADAAAVAAAAKAAKAMENISLPALVSPVSRKPPVDILPNTSPSVSHPSSAPPARAQDVHTSTAAVTSPLQREGSVVGAPQPQHSAPAVYDAHYGAAPELALPSSNSVPALDADEKHAGMFDGADMGENLLPSNILGLDDAPYPSNKPSHSDPVASGNAQILPMHDASFSSSLDQSKTLSPITHARPYTCSDHGAPAHLGAPLSAAGGFPSHSQPPPPAHNVRDRLPDHPQLWGVPCHEWDAHGQQQQPPLHPPSSDLHLHAGGFGSVPVPAPGAYSSPSKGPQHSPVPGAAPGVSSAQPVFHNSFGYPSGTVFSMPSFAPNAQMHMPLVPTSKPPDWSNNGPTTLGWNAMHAHGVPQSRPVSVLGAPGSMQKSQDSGSFQMQDPQGAHNGYPQGGVPMQGSMPGGHPHAPQPRMRLSDVEMQLPDNLGLGAGPQIGHLPLATPQNSQHISQPSNMHVRSGGGSGNGGNGGNRSNNRTRNNNNSGGGGMSGHTSGGGHGLGTHNSNFQSGNRGGAGDAANSNSGVGRGDGHRQHGGGHSGSETEHNNNSNRRHGGRSRGGHGRNHGRRGRGGGHANDNAAATAASLVSVE